MTVTTPPSSSSRYRIYEAASSRPQTRAATRPGRDDRSRRPASTATPPPQGSAPTGPAATVPRDGVVRSASPGFRTAWPARQDRDGDRARVAVDGADAGDAGRLRDVLPHRCQWPPATARGRRGAPSLKLVPVPRVRRPRVRRDPGRPERGREALIPAGRSIAPTRMRASPAVWSRRVMACPSWTGQPSPARAGQRLPTLELRSAVGCTRRKFDHAHALEPGALETQPAVAVAEESFHQWGRTPR